MALVLGPLRHRCFACGGGCHGCEVQWFADERGPLAKIAEELGIEDPFEGPFLRRQDGTCVFLDSDDRCRIHTAYGLRAKPRVCQQYPLMAVQAGDDLRLAVDPGCLYAWKSFRTGPEPETGALMRSDGTQTLAWQAEEQALLALLDPSRRTVSAALQALAVDPVLLLGRVQLARLGQRIGHRGTAPSIRARLAHVTSMLEDLELAETVWSVGPEEDAWAVEATRRFVFSRVARRYRPVVRGLGMLAGALVCGWADPDPERFGPALAAWSRMIRTEALGTLFPDDETVRAVGLTAKE